MAVENRACVHHLAREHKDASPGKPLVCRVEVAEVTIDGLAPESHVCCMSGGGEPAA